MKIDQTGNSQSAEVTGARGSRHADRAHARKQNGASSGASSGTESAKTEISARAKELAHAKHVASSSPEVREEKIAELKRRIAEGKYKVDADAVAGKLVDEHLQMSGIG